MKALLLFLLIIIPSVAFSEEEIVFSEPGILYIELQKGIVCQSRFSLLTEKVVLLEDMIKKFEEDESISTKQIETLSKKIVTLWDLQLVQDSTITELTKLVQTQKEGYEKIIKMQKPSFFQKLKNNALMMGTGFILGVLVTVVP